VTVISNTEFGDYLSQVRHTAFRLELQPAYSEPSEQATVARFLSGDPQPPTEVEGLRQWFAQVAAQTAEGVRISRVRVHDDPPTDYQRWERWIGAWNVSAGEDIQYLTRSRAHEIGLLPAAGNQDWWLLDSQQLLVMTFDAQGHRVQNELITEDHRVVQACGWRDLAVHHSAPATRSAAA
jgi:hypothetical protein